MGLARRRFPVSRAEVNPAGWIVHRVVYEAVPEAQCVMHLRTTTGAAVPAQKSGLPFTATSPTTINDGPDFVPRNEQNSSPISETSR
jgi:ribulose-5-phosphate 4-epimerase/fuculose-1-phosphate aldolase